MRHLGQKRSASTRCGFSCSTHRLSQKLIDLCRCRHKAQSFPSVCFATVDCSTRLQQAGRRWSLLGGTRLALGAILYRTDFGRCRCDNVNDESTTTADCCVATAVRTVAPARGVDRSGAVVVTMTPPS